MVELQLPKLAVRVRFPLPAPKKKGADAPFFFGVDPENTLAQAPAKCGRDRISDSPFRLAGPCWVRLIPVTFVTSKIPPESRDFLLEQTRRTRLARQRCANRVICAPEFTTLPHFVWKY